MARRKLTEHEKMKRNSSRNMEVFKRDDMIQKARYRLSVQEQRCVLYAISKIKPEDTAFSEYSFELNDFYAMCGLQNESYTELKEILRALKSKSWWVEIDDQGTESAVSWFNVVRSNKRSGKVTIKFHEDMMPFLLDLAKQNTFYTSYNLKYILPMNSQYSPRLYELLKSYQKNQSQWFFDIDDLKYHLDCQNYKNFADFSRFVLEPAVEEINRYTDLAIGYDLQRKGRKVVRVVFFLDEKTPLELDTAEREIETQLDGQIDILAEVRENIGSAKTEFAKQRAAAYKKQREQG